MMKVQKSLEKELLKNTKDQKKQTSKLFEIARKIADSFDTKLDIKNPQEYEEFPEQIKPSVKD